MNIPRRTDPFHSPRSRLLTLAQDERYRDGLVEKMIERLPNTTASELVRHTENKAKAQAKAEGQAALIGLGVTAFGGLCAILVTAVSERRRRRPA